MQRRGVGGAEKKPNKRMKGVWRFPLEKRCLRSRSGEGEGEKNKMVTWSLLFSPPIAVMTRNESARRTKDSEGGAVESV